MRTRSKASLYAALGMGVLLACDARATPPTSIPLPSSASAAAESIRPESLGLPTETPVTLARRAMERRDAAHARGIAEAALEGASPADAPRLRMLAGLAALALGQTDAGVAHLATFDADSGHPLAPWAKLARALALETHTPASALDLAADLSVRDFPGKESARRLEARVRLATGDTEGALTSLRALARELAGENLAEVAVPLAAALVARGDAASLAEALELQHRLFAKAPRTSAGRLAEAQMNELAARLGAAGRARRAPDASERIEHADGLASGRADQATEAYDAALEALATSDARRCAVRLARARVIERGRDRRRTATELTALAETCQGDELRGWSLFKAGRALQQANEDDAALLVFAKLEELAPGSRFADDGALAVIRAHLEAGRLDAMRERAADLVARYPAGDMRADAWFLWAWSLRKEGKHEEALALLRASRAAVPVEPGEENGGRAAYWEARTLSGLERRDEAVAAFEALARAMPLTYYGMSALSRLGELDEPRARAVRAWLATAGATPAAGSNAEAVPGELAASLEATLGSALGASIDRAGLARASELLMVGETAHAAAELAALGLVGEGASDERLFVAANLYVMTDHPNEAVDLVRRRLADTRAAVPSGAARARLRLGYPRAFAPLIEEAAARASVPPTFVRAIAREESSFNPNAVSRANAYGLVQILVSTARGYEHDVGFAPTAENLRHAPTNLAFATRYMARLFHRYEVNPALVPAAYNAGHGSVGRWLRQDHARPFDEFVEEIPYEETRKYTRRVLQSYGIYSLLDAGEIPTFGAALPVE